jgi:hypothetical protein
VLSLRTYGAIFLDPVILGKGWDVVRYDIDLAEVF